MKPCYLFLTIQFFLPNCHPVQAQTHNLTPVAIDFKAITDSLSAKQQSYSRKFIPRQATIRSLVVPGWGQFYNRQCWKVPVIYVGAGIAFGIFSLNQAAYSRYMAAYREAYNAPAINPQFNTKTAIVDGKIRTIDYLKVASNQYRRQRDLTIILTIAGWALNAVEANVAAHLKTFDVSETISMNVRPTILASPASGFIPGIRIILATR